jgi:outer membrane protein assembly factor BamB
MSLKKFLLFALLIFSLVACSVKKSETPGAATPTELSNEEVSDLTSYSFQKRFFVTQAKILNGIAYLDLVEVGDSIEATKIRAIDLPTGNVLWTIDQKLLLPSTNDGNRIFLLTSNGIAAYSMNNGTEIWRKNLTLDEYPIGELLASTDGLLFYADSQGAQSFTHVYAFDTKTGTNIWTTSIESNLDPFASVALPKSGYRAIGYDDGKLYLRLCGEDSVHWKYVALDAKSGKKLWEFTFKMAIPQEGIVTGVASEPVLGQERLYFGTYDDHFYSLNKSTGQLIWDRKQPFHRPISNNGRFFALDSSGEVLNAFNAVTGELEWTKPFLDQSELGRLSAIIFDDRLIVFVAPVSFDEPYIRITATNLKTGQGTYTLQSAISKECSGFALALSVFSGKLYGITDSCVIVVDDIDRFIK